MCELLKKRGGRNNSLVNILVAMQKKPKTPNSPSNRLLHSCYYASSAPQYASHVEFVQSPVNLRPTSEFLLSIYIPYLY